MPDTASRAGPLAALLAEGPGHRFVVYGDSCSGVAGALHERTFASVNAVVRRLQPPEFVLFLGDEIAGLSADPDALRAQWRHWLEHEMGWLDRSGIPLQPHPGLRRASPSRRAAGLLGRRGNCPSHARGRRVSPLRASRARRGGAALSGARHRWLCARAVALAAAPARDRAVAGSRSGRGCSIF